MTASPGRLRSEFLEDPLGLNPRPPILSWRSGDTRAAECQTSWQVLAASRPAMLRSGQADLWDSGWVSASAVCSVRYGGPVPGARERIWWAVRTRDSDGLPSDYSRPAFFETGLADEADWHAEWIGVPHAGSRHQGPGPALLAGDFELQAMPVRARLYLALAGTGQMTLNGERLLRGEQMPLSSDYRARVRYRVLDVSAALRLGNNRLGVLLADGHFAGNQGWTGTRESFGRSPLIRAQLELLNSDGTMTRICSDGRWRCKPSAAGQADPVLGESWDERARTLFWSRPAEPLDAARGWGPVLAAPGPAGRLCADLSPRLDERRLIKPDAEPLLVLDERSNARWIYTLPERLLGQPQVSVALPENEALEIGYEPASSISDRVTLGRARAVSGPKLGLRVCDRVTVTVPATAMLRDAPAAADPALLAATTAPTLAFSALTLPLAQALQVSCDESALQTMLARWTADLRWQAARRPLAGYGLGEGFGPPSSAGLMAELPVAAGMDDVLPLLGRTVAAAPLLRSYLEDLIDAEARTGTVPFTVPDLPTLGVGEQSGQFALLVDVVWTLLLEHGDWQAGAEGYACARRVLMTLCDEAGTGGLLARRFPGSKDPDPPELTGTAVLYRCLCRAASIAELLGKTADQALWSRLCEQSRLAFQSRYVTADGVLASNSQTALTLVLDSGLLAESGGAAQTLSLTLRGRLVPAHGLGGAPGLGARCLSLLSRGGFAQVAVAELVHEPRQAALAARYGRTLGAAALLEWVLADWLGVRSAPVNLPEDLGLRRLRIAPLLGIAPGIGQLSGQFETLRGRVEVSWDERGAQPLLRVALPTDVEAEIQVPGHARTVLRSGTHELTLDRQLLPVDAIPQLQQPQVQRR